MQVTIRDDFPEVDKALQTAGKQARFAAAVALTRTARDVREDEKAEMRRAFDRPTPYTLNSLFVAGATKENLQARVWLKDDALSSGTRASDYLLPHIGGGTRAFKGMEKMLQRIGVLPRGWFAVPGEGAQIDAYGNMARGQITQILSYLQAFGEQGYSANITADKKAKMAKGTKKKRGSAYFVSAGKLRDKTRHLPAGVYRRTGFGALGTAIQPVLVFVPKVNYRKRFPFFEVAQRTVAAKFQGHFDVAFAEALRTAVPGAGGQR